MKSARTSSKSSSPDFHDCLSLDRRRLQGLSRDARQLQGARREQAAAEFAALLENPGPPLPRGGPACLGPSFRPICRSMRSKKKSPR